MRKERKSKDLLLDAILLRALEEENKELESEIRAANEALTKEEDERLKALLKATWKKEQARQRRNRYLLRTAVCFAVMLVVSSSVVMNVQAWRANVINYVLTVFEDHGVLSPKENVSTHAKERYLPTYIPEEYPNKEIVFDDENMLAIYYHGNDGMSTITYQILYEDTNTFIDTENAQIKYINHNDQELIILTKDNHRQLIGLLPGTTYRYLITGEISEEELLRISDSLRQEKEE